MMGMKNSDAEHGSKALRNLPRAIHWVMGLAVLMVAGFTIPFMALGLDISPFVAPTLMISILSLGLMHTLVGHVIRNRDEMKELREEVEALSAAQGGD